MDVSTILDGYFSDASRMFKMGKISKRAERLIRVTEDVRESRSRSSQALGTSR